MSEQIKKLTVKQRKFIRAYLETGNATESAKAAGYKCKNDPSYAEMGHQNLRKLEGVMCQVLIEAGLDNAVLAKKAFEGLDAHVTKPFAHEGVVITEKTYVDYPTRARYLEIVSKMKGLLKDHVESKTTGVIEHIHVLHPELEKKLYEIYKLSCVDPGEIGFKESAQQEYPNPGGETPDGVVD